MAQTLIALYENASLAREVVNSLVNAGFDRANITVDPPLDGAWYDDDGSKGGVGNFLNRLFNIDVPEGQAHVYAESVRRGNYAVTIIVNDGDIHYAEDILSDYNPIDIDTRGDYFQSEGWSTYDINSPMYNEDEVESDRERYRRTYANGTSGASTGATSDSYSISADTQVSREGRANNVSASTADNREVIGDGEARKLEVVEEELNVGKRQVEGGHVRVRQFVTEHPVEATVRLREEHVTVQRNPVDRTANSADFNAEENTIEINEMREEAVIGKTAHVVEEVIIGKEVTEHEETVRDTVRRKDVDVETEGDTSFTTVRNSQVYGSSEASETDR